jgi:O-acetyl-ADP-ribose deacetylase (regulator of RNase III)
LECDAIIRKQGYSEPTGKAKITKAYNLPSDYILHTVGPIVDGQVTDEHRISLSSCYHSCLELADENDVNSVAFCCISTGEFHYPNEEAARIAVKAVSDGLKSCHNVKKVVFNVFKEQDERIYRSVLG